MSNKTDKKMLGFFTVLALVMGTMIGVGILITPSLMVEYGAYGYIAWPVASLLCMSLAFMFSKMSSVVIAHGPADFVTKAFGSFAGFQVSWAHWLGFTCAQGLIAYSFGNYIFPEYGIYISLIGLWLLTFLSMFMKIFSMSTVLILTTLKVSMLTIIVFAGLPYLSLDKIAALPVHNGLSGGSAFLGALAFCLLAFIGLELATLSGDNVKKPKVTVPLATIVGTLFAAVLYTLSYAVVGSAFSQEQLLSSNRPVYDAVGLFIGSFAQPIFKIIAGLGFIASINGVLFAQSYILKNAANNKTLPTIFAHTTKADFPSFSAIISAAAATMLILGFHYNVLITGVVGGFSACFVSIVYLWSVAAYRHFGGNIFMWLVNFFTAILFLSGSVEMKLIPVAVFVYCGSAFLYGIFSKNKYVQDLQ